MDSGTFAVDTQIGADGRPVGADSGLRYLYDRIGRQLSRTRVDQQLRRIWPRRCLPNSRDDGPDILALAINLLAYAPDPKGRTAFDRLATRERMPDPETGETLKAARQATFKVMRIVDIQGNGWATGHDVLSGSAHALTILDAQLDDIVAGFMAPASAGYLWPTSVYVRLPHGMADVPAEMLDRSGTRFKNPMRAAERLYANAVAGTLDAGKPITDMMHIPGQTSDEDVPEEPTSQARLEAGPDAPAFLHDFLEIADRWADLLPADPREADPATVRRLRQDAQPDTALVAADLASRARAESPQGRALDILARVLVETVEHRAALGLGQTTLDALNALARASRPGETAISYLHRLRAELRPGDGSADGKQARVIAQVRALQAKTEAAGCTEAEAVAAAEKAEELLRRYDISLTPAQVSDQACQTATMPTGRKQPDGIDACVNAIAAVCDCRTWVQTCPHGYRTHVFFGLPADVAAAETVYRIVRATFAAETVSFKESDTYRGLHPNDRGQATKSFRWGLGDGIREKLEHLAEDRARQTAASSGRDLVVAKQQTLEAGLDKLGLALKRDRVGKRYVDRDAYDRGVESGRAFAPDDRLPPPA